jgi:hypothetical protein
MASSVGIALDVHADKPQHDHERFATMMISEKDDLLSESILDRFKAKYTNDLIKSWCSVHL